MASNNEPNSQLSSCIDKSISKRHLNEHEETVKSDQMASKKSLSSNDGEEQIASMDENDLKNLLDEALTYKNPRDANEKSETFKRLLQNVTEEEEHKRKFESNSLHWKAQSNSLQNLLDESHYQLQNHQSQISSKKHPRRKNSTSVSTRRLEGGSLPVDMHHSSTIQSPPDQPFLSELKNNKKRKEKQLGKDVNDTLDVETDDRKSFQRCFEANKDNSSYHDAIEMKSMNRAESEIPDHSASKYTTANNMPNTSTTMASTMTQGNSIPVITKHQPSSTTSVDARIQFPSMLETPKSYQQAQTMDTLYTSTINHHNNITLTGGGSSSNYGTSSSGGKLVSEQPLQLPSGAGVNSVIDPKSFSYSSKYKTGQTRDDVSSLQTTPSILPTSHSSTTTVTTATAPKDNSKTSKKRTAKSERNEKKIDVRTIEGYRGDDPIEKLLTYIDGQHNVDSKGQKYHPKNGFVSNNISNNDKQTNEQLLNADDKKKKLVSKSKEKMNKLKKSNSMEELYSTGRQQEKEKSSANVAINSSSSSGNKISQDVTLRSKNNNNGDILSGIGNKKAETKADKWQTKRNERRSWGTEGLWPDSTADIESRPKSSEQNEHDQSNEIESSSSSSSGGGTGVAQIDFKDSAIVSTGSNFDPTNNASSEADKFQVVIKKKKVKRKSNENPDTKASNTPTSNNLQTYVIRRDSHLRTKPLSTANNNSNIASSRNDRNPNYNNNSNSNKYDKNTKPASQDAKQNSIGKNRRKSTSSMPHSDDEYSDGGDSVQSLPIETTKTTSSLLSAPNNNQTNNHSSAEYSGKVMTKSSKSATVSNPATQMSPLQQQQQQQPPATSIQQKPTTFSYADIAKTNTHRTNTNNVVPASTEKMWPSISSSVSSTHQNSNMNNLNNNNDPFAISNFDAISNNNSSSHQNSTSSSNNPTAGNLATKQHKSTPSLKNIMSFPDLVVESNNNKNKQISNSPMDINGDAAQTEKSTFNGLEKAFDNNNNPAAINSQDRLNNNSNTTSVAANGNVNKISYSQSLLENHHPHEVDANGNTSNAKIESTGIVIAPNVAKSTLIKSKSVDHNNLSSIEHYPALEKTKQTLSDVLSKPIESLSKTTKTKQQSPQQQQQIKIGTVETTVVKEDNGMQKKNKKDKLGMNKKGGASIVSTTTLSGNQSYSNTANNSNNAARPAVIIMDDCEKSSEFEFGITFGFDINEHLLFGHQNGDAVAEIEHSVEMNNSNIKNNNSNCDIMNTNLSSNNTLNNNLNNLTNQSCGFELYDNFITMPPLPTSVVVDQSQQILPTPQQQHQVTIIQSSPKIMTITNDNTTLLDSSNDLGYMSSSLITNSTTSPANQKISTTNDIQQQQPSTEISDNSQYENEFGQNYPNAMDIKQHLKLEELISRFVSPEPAKNFNYDELVTFVSEEWTKVERNGVIFNGQ